MKHVLSMRIVIVFSLLIWSLSAAAAENGIPALSRLAHAMNDSAGLALEGDSFSFVAEGPNAEIVLKTEDEFYGRIDLKAAGINPLTLSHKEISNALPPQINIHGALPSWRLMRRRTNGPEAGL